jgi:hypothetical protein
MAVLNHVSLLSRSSFGNYFYRALGFHFGALFTATALMLTSAQAQVTSLDQNYTVSLFASGPQLPFDMVFRPAFNDLLVTEEEGAIKRVDGTTGAVSVFAVVPSDIPPDRGLFTLYGIAADSLGNVFAPAFETLPATTPILDFNPQGTLVMRLIFPGRGLGVAFDSADNLYIISQPVTGGGGQIVYRYAIPYQSPPTIFANGFVNLQTIAFNSAGALFGADDGAGIVYRITPGGMTAASHTVLASGLTQPFSVAIEPATQDIFVGNRDGTVKSISQTGTVSTFATGFSAISANALAFDTNGNLYVADQFTSAIWKFTHHVPGSPATISPIAGGNAGSVSATITGSGFQFGAQVKLTGLGTDILGANTTVAGAGSVLTATFALVGAPVGSRTVIVTNPDGSMPANINNGFTIQQGGAPQISVNIIGLNQIRLGRAQTYYLQAVNTGSVDSPPGLVSLSLPSMIAVQEMNGPDLFTAGSTSDLAFGVAQFGNITAANALRVLASAAVSGSSQVLLLATSGVPAGGSQTAPVSLFDVSASNFTVTSAWQQDQYPSNFDDYLAQHSIAYYPIVALQSSLCTQCDVQPLTAAYYQARAPYEAFQTAWQQAVLQLPVIVVSMAKAGIEAAAVESAGLPVLGTVLLTALVTQIDTCISSYLGDSSNQGCLGSVNDQLTPARDAAVAALTNNPNLTAVAKKALGDFSTAATAALDQIGTIGDLNQAIGAEKAFFNKFIQFLGQYKTALTNYETCINQCVSNPPQQSPTNTLGTTSLTITGVTSLDPNDKSGPVGAGSQQFVNGTGPLEYLIAFENQSSATAPVQQLSVVDQLAPSSFQTSTATLGPIRVNGNQLTPPSGSQAYSGQIDLRPVQSLLLNVTANINATSGFVNWQMAAIDPTTGLPPTNPLVGFLAPGQDGSVSLKALPNTGLATGALVSNQANITFDVNPAISTPVWTNTIDSTPPSTRVQALAATQTQPAYSVNWSGSDVGSGIAGYSIYRSVDGGAFQLWLANTTATSATDTGQPGHTYAYISQGVDLVGNTEALRAGADTSTAIQASACADDATTLVVIQRGGFRLNNATGQFVQSVTLTNAGSNPIPGPVSLVVMGLSMNAALFNKTGNTVCSSPAGSPFIDIGIQTSLAAGQSVTTTLQFTDPTRTGITYNARVLAGSVNR